MTTPDVTVVVPVYNTMPYLTACLDSLVRQTIGPDRLHVVAVDDGSTDGSGAVLDRHAEQHPGLFTVIHQENSGGPAQPCNVGLAAATGRFVFFLGADDHLGDEALERMVARADEWGSDVVCARLVGVNGRWVNQRLFQRDEVDVPFPSRLLASGLSNTKLFRRSVLEENGISYPLGMRIGSDQPFTIEAMLHARRISVLADYEYYYAVKRDDEQNLTYSTPWHVRFAGIAAVVRRVAALVEPGEGRDAILARHFSGELARLLRIDLGELGAAEQEELVRDLTALAHEYLTDGMQSELRVLARLRYRLAAEGRLDDLRALVGAEDRRLPLEIGEDRASILVPGFTSRYPRSMFEVTVEPLKPLVLGAVHGATASWDGSWLQLRADTDFLPASEPHVRIDLSHTLAGASRWLREYPRKPAAGPRSGVASLDAHGVLTARLDVGDLLGADPALRALRLQVDIGDRTVGMPVPAETVVAAQVCRGDMLFDVITRPDPNGRMLVEVRPAPEPATGSTTRRNGSK